jgi:hypothetical protein
MLCGVGSDCGVGVLSTIIVYENKECSRNHEASVKRDDKIIEVEIVKM